MNYSQAELSQMKGSATQIINFIGHGCGFTRREIADVVERIERKTPALVAHCREKETGKNPYRIVLLAMVDLRKSEESTWKPWRAARIQRNIQRYSEWWNHLDPSSGVARAIDPVAARLQTA